ncbi:dienelactone hydrolase family protein [Ceratobasidium sp. AG-Ba]|nr:dienelactone hydrolase family protein [Ceratobasidium sp. AG-Ba]
MLITKTHHDIKASNGQSEYSLSRQSFKDTRRQSFQESWCSGECMSVFDLISIDRHISEIYQVTGPVERFAGQIASQGYVVACPSSYHEFVGPEPLDYDTKGTDLGNDLKIQKELAAYDEDATLSVDLLMSLPNCSGRIAATGMCLGGHLAFRAAFDPRVLASVCFFATDIHSKSLGKGKNDDSLARVERGDVNAELVMIFGKQDTHVPRAGRDLIRKTLEDANVTFSWLEVQAQHAFIRDEHSKGRWDAALTRSCFNFMMEGKSFTKSYSLSLTPASSL